MATSEPLSNEVKQTLQAELGEIFDKYDLDVALGLSADGIAIRSQDKRVDAQSIGPVRAL